MKNLNLVVYVLVSICLMGNTSSASASDCAAKEHGGECHQYNVPESYGVNADAIKLDYQFFPSLSGNKASAVYFILSDSAASNYKMKASEELAKIRRTHAVVVYSGRNVEKSEANFRKSVKDLESLRQTVTLRHDVDPMKFETYAEGSDAAVNMFHTSETEGSIKLTMNANMDDMNPVDVPSTDMDENALSEVYDPHEEFNRDMLAFNLALKDNFMDPVVDFYEKAVPAAIREGAGNFINNLKRPLYFGHQLLQGEGEEALNTFDRFFVDTFFGLGGIFHLSKKVKGEQPAEDMGQTLAVWGFGEGFYTVLPFIGPGSVRSVAGKIIDSQIDPVSQFAPFDQTAVSISRKALDELSNYKGKEIDELRRTSIDFYATVRSLYRQNRASEIRNDYKLSQPKRIYLPFEDQEENME